MLVKSRVLKNIQVVVSFFAALLLVVTFSALAVQAQSNGSSSSVLKVSPLRTDIQVEPGASGTVEILVTNLTSSDILVRPFENDFIAGDEKGTPSIILDQDEYAPTHSLKRFLAPLPDVTVPANDSVIVEVQINVPAGTQAGGYFGAIRLAPADPEGGGQVNANASVASLILLTVPGDMVEKISLTDFSLIQGTKSGTDFRTPNDLKVSFRFQNEGNLQIGPFGKVSVTQGKEVVYDADFNNKSPRDVILPDSARRWDVPLENIGSFGRYTVSATFTYGAKNQSIDVVRTFWVIPTGVIIGAIIGLVLLIGLIVWLVIFLVKRKRRQSSRHASSGMGRLR